MKCASLLVILFLSSCSTNKVEPQKVFIEKNKDLDKIWVEDKISPAQPFPANIVAVTVNWDGYELLLEEVSMNNPRYCYVIITMALDMKYTITTKEGSEKLFLNHPQQEWRKKDFVSSVTDFKSDMLGFYKIGKSFGKEDILYKKIKAGRL